MAETIAAPAKRTPVWLFGTLDIPYGIITTGLFTTSMSYLLGRSGMPVGQIGNTIALLTVPITFYYLYAPVVDFFMRRKIWAALSGSLAGLLAGFALYWLTIAPKWSLAMLFVASALVTLVSATTGGMMAALLTREEKGKAAGWMQGGNLGAGSVIGGVLLLLAPNHGNGLLGAIIAVSCVATALTALYVREPHREKTGANLPQTFRELGMEMKATFLTWRSLPGLIMLASPIGTGAMQQLMGSLTKEYGATAGQLAIGNGFGGGAATFVGSLCGVLWPARWNRMLPYAASAFFYMLVTGGLAVAPMRPWAFISGLLLSNFSTGLCYACYTGLVLQTLGVGGRRQSTRYTLLNGVGNLPVVYMASLCGQAGAHWGPRGVAGFDALANGLTVLVFGAWWFAYGRRWTATNAVAEIGA